MNGWMASAIMDNVRRIASGMSPASALARIAAGDESSETLDAARRELARWVDGMVARSRAPGPEQAADRAPLVASGQAAYDAIVAELIARGDYAERSANLAKLREGKAGAKFGDLTASLLNNIDAGRWSHIHPSVLADLLARGLIEHGIAGMHWQLTPAGRAILDRAFDTPGYIFAEHTANLARLRTQRFIAAPGILDHGWYVVSTRAGDVQVIAGPFAHHDQAEAARARERVGKIAYLDDDGWDLELAGFDYRAEPTANLAKLREAGTRRYNIGGLPGGYGPVVADFGARWAAEHGRVPSRSEAEAALNDGILIGMRASQLDIDEFIAGASAAVNGTYRERSPADAASLLAHADNAALRPNIEAKVGAPLVARYLELRKERGEHANATLLAQEAVERFADWRWTIQVIDTYPSEADAQQALAAQRIQQGFIDGRVYLSTKDRPEGVWTMQSIHETNGEAPHGWLPDGMRHVMWRGYFAEDKTPQRFDAAPTTLTLAGWRAFLLDAQAPGATVAITAAQRDGTPGGAATIVAAARAVGGSAEDRYNEGMVVRFKLGEPTANLAKLREGKGAARFGETFQVGDRVFKSLYALEPLRSAWLLDGGGKKQAKRDAFDAAAAMQGTVTDVIDRGYMTPAIHVTWDDGTRSQALDYMVSKTRISAGYADGAPTQKFAGWPVRASARNPSGSGYGWKKYAEWTVAQKFAALDGAASAAIAALLRLDAAMNDNADGIHNLAALMGEARAAFGRFATAARGELDAYDVGKIGDFERALAGSTIALASLREIEGFVDDVWRGTRRGKTFPYAEGGAAAPSFAERVSSRRKATIGR